MVESAEDLCYSFISFRQSRYDSLTVKKRRNKKEARDRGTAMELRASQREACARQLEDDRRHLEELNLQVDSLYLRKQLKKQEVLNKNEEKAKLYMEAMVREAVGEPPTGLSEAKRKDYDRRVEEMKRSLGGGSKTHSSYGDQNSLYAAMLRSLST